MAEVRIIRSSKKVEIDRQKKRDARKQWKQAQRCPECKKLRIWREIRMDGYSFATYRFFCICGCQWDFDKTRRF